ncbi:MAG: N-acetyl-gamma-glutamyl-phosphate reductase, partial [bacterium]
MKVGIINITGYAGSELARILYRHPEVEITSVTGRSAAGQQLNEVFPHLTAMNMAIEPELSGSLDMVFSALPHKASAEACIPVLEQGVKVVDISADFRLKQADEYTEWYGVDHPDPTYLEEAVYGLPELHRDDVTNSRLVANPGCYPTSAILGLAPAVAGKIITQDIIIDSKSGVSGGGRSLTMTNHFSEVNENVFAYALKGHRHLPEITQELAPLTEKSLNLTFLTHLIPMTRGILSSCYATLIEPGNWTGDEGQEKILDLYRDYYADDP